MYSAPFSTFMLPSIREVFAALAVELQQDTDFKYIHDHVHNSILSLNAEQRHFLTRLLVLFC